MKKIALFFIVFCLFGFSYTPNPTETQNFSSLKAVLVIGSFEDYEGDKSESITEMDALAKFMQSKGIQIKKFYNKNSDWEAIKKAAQYANFFVYHGHGSTLGENGKVGGLCLVDRISSKQLIAELKLPKNAVVIFDSVCGGAGSSASDEGDIGMKEAATRVNDYAAPFFKIGVGCYYANNYTDANLNFIRSLLEGKTIATLFKENHPSCDYTGYASFDKTKQVRVVSSAGGAKGTRTSYPNGVAVTTEYIFPKTYDIACVANPNFSIKDVLSK